jgi:hypothetical protein
MGMTFDFSSTFPLAHEIWIYVRSTETGKTGFKELAISSNPLFLVWISVRLSAKRLLTGSCSFSHGGLYICILESDQLFVSERF